ncbi:hypothetical protein OIU34_23955 [Pararhizobium sp. BT-229]|uniref:hypothetical protein n=1 Tax=Pararhizobium sp. BT-229 TaxID=2986923 RepID=UPI0021F6A488|nr:hypothetical protein [Pararhizobium sp. BT-229]MCV9964953.1 hypothetical protein [Pararhizobium sp. BT-229]
MTGPYVIEHGDVWSVPENSINSPLLMPNRTHVCDGTEDLAIALLDDTMLKHGSAAAVEAWVEKKAAGIDVTIIRFPVSPETVAELNLCARNTTRAASIVDNLMAIGHANPGLANLPKYPR